MSQSQPAAPEEPPVQPSQSVPTASQPETHSINLDGKVYCSTLNRRCAEPCDWDTEASKQRDEEPLLSQEAPAYTPYYLSPVRPALAWVELLLRSARERG
mmetsp:Transcript_48377/g.80412  ORF Transcript_48377/g.80412 Transcript_48377/m.80412 type:complete len:100 (+) Transcript_48377:627-926(+)